MFLKIERARVVREAMKSFPQDFSTTFSTVMQTRPSALLFEGFPRDDLLAVMGRERIQRLVHVSFIRRRRLLASAAREVARSRT